MCMCLCIMHCRIVKLQYMHRVIQIQLMSKISYQKCVNINAIPHYMMLENIMNSQVVYKYMAQVVRVLHVNGLLKKHTHFINPWT